MEPDRGLILRQYSYYEVGILCQPNKLRCYSHFWAGRFLLYRIAKAQYPFSIILGRGQGTMRQKAIPLAVVGLTGLPFDLISRASKIQCDEYKPATLASKTWIGDVLPESGHAVWAYASPPTAFGMRPKHLPPCPQKAVEPRPIKLHIVDGAASVVFIFISPPESEQKDAQPVESSTGPGQRFRPRSAARSAPFRGSSGTHVPCTYLHTLDLASFRADHLKISSLPNVGTAFVSRPVASQRVTSWLVGTSLGKKVESNRWRLQQVFENCVSSIAMIQSLSEPIARPPVDCTPLFLLHTPVGIVTDGLMLNGKNKKIPRTSNTQRYNVHYDD
ncbi:hypothetical protein ACRALDRAFT_206627 [Sodiomyces alcalophilus JCM 7366]|uniref:uncharacterized protein n=1 Tax=Sodiomyces alcalophilus JCM 7366 TaxID=591952 RepID=UPI0039B5F858